MSQPQQQYSPRAFSPVQSQQTSQNATYGLLPNKRQRLSPDPRSPYSSPSMSNIALPNQVFSSPHYGVQPNGPSAYANSSYNNANSPPAPPASHPAQGGTMGPPSRPADKDKPTDMNELSDVLAGSGVDLREEEANLVRINNSTQER